MGSEILQGPSGIEHQLVVFCRSDGHEPKVSCSSKTGPYTSLVLYFVPAGHAAEIHLDSIFMTDFITRPPVVIVVFPDPVMCSGLSA